MGTKDHGLSIEEADDLLAGHIPAGRDDLGALATDLASLSAIYRHEVDAVDLRRWAAQAGAQARLDPSDKGDLAATSASNAYRPAPQAAGLPKRRIPVLNAIAAFVATTVGKTVVAGALVAATTTGALAASGSLPGQSEPTDPVVIVDATESDVADTPHDGSTTDDCEADDLDATEETDTASTATDDCAADDADEADEAGAADEANTDDDADDDADDADEADADDDADEADADDDADEVDDADEADDADDTDDDADEADDADDTDDDADEADEG